MLLLGDGVETVGIARNDEQRARVTADLRHMRAAFEALLAERQNAGRAEDAEARVAQLEDDLLRIATELAEAPPPEVFLAPADAARELGMSTSSLYRAVRRGEVSVLRAMGGPMRVPSSEVRRLADGIRES